MTARQKYLTSLANSVIQQAPCCVITCFCFVLASLAFLRYFVFGAVRKRTETMCETNDHLLAGAWWINYKEGKKTEVKFKLALHHFEPEAILQLSRFNLPLT